MVFEKSIPPPPLPNIKILEAKAKLFSLLAYWWANDLMSLGYKHPLGNDLYVLNEMRSANIVKSNGKKFNAVSSNTELVLVYALQSLQFLIDVLKNLLINIFIVE
ncbi:16214_t:CDS:2 [Dentiscutata erythropus]|uniref:16214_t:CDS:1 n=1 Tax=Dentiscutata erythropus TaxID=1348616 RepID=A0A9N8VBT2_9GLOM|nr:16214_t:CDS:2 [Dentiscutata erythropus]